jgi:hypothetical protein
LELLKLGEGTDIQLDKLCENESTPRFTSIHCMSWSRFASIQYFNVCHGLVKEAVGRLGLCHGHGQVVYLNRVFIS